jgi:hypothetical protein
VRVINSNFNLTLSHASIFAFNINALTYIVGHRGRIFRKSFRRLSLIDDNVGRLGGRESRKFVIG